MFSSTILWITYLSSIILASILSCRYRFLSWWYDGSKLFHAIGKTSRVVPSPGLRAPLSRKFANLEQILSINDPNFCNGHYYDGPEPLRGLALARMISHKTFVSLSDMEARMTDRCEQEKDEFSWYKICRPLESYLLHKGISLFANTTPTLSKFNCCLVTI